MAIWVRDPRVATQPQYHILKRVCISTDKVTTFLHPPLLATMLDTGNDGLKPRPGSTPKLIEGPQVGNRSLYRQQVLDVSRSHLSSLTSRRTSIPKRCPISSGATSSQTFHNYTPQTTILRPCRTMIQSSCHRRSGASRALPRKRKEDGRLVARRLAIDPRPNSRLRRPDDASWRWRVHHTCLLADEEGHIGPRLEREVGTHHAETTLFAGARPRPKTHTTCSTTMERVPRGQPSAEEHRLFATTSALTRSNETIHPRTMRRLRRSSKRRTASVAKSARRGHLR